MERGKLGVEERSRQVFVFEGLVANCTNPKLERAALKLHLWERALSFWELHETVASRLRELHNLHNIPLEILTWHHVEFARLLADWLSDRHVFVSGVTFGWKYAECSPVFSQDHMIDRVYDPDPEHRFGYGFKAKDYWSDYPHG